MSTRGDLTKAGRGAKKSRRDDQPTQEIRARIALPDAWVMKVCELDLTCDLWIGPDPDWGNAVPQGDEEILQERGVIDPDESLEWEATLYVAPPDYAVRMAILREGRVITAKTFDLLEHVVELEPDCVVEIDPYELDLDEENIEKDQDAIQRPLVALPTYAEVVAMAATFRAAATALKGALDLAQRMRAECWPIANPFHEENLREHFASLLSKGSVGSMHTIRELEDLAEELWPGPMQATWVKHLVGGPEELDPSEQFVTPVPPEPALPGPRKSRGRSPRSNGDRPAGP